MFTKKVYRRLLYLVAALLVASSAMALLMGIAAEKDDPGIMLVEAMYDFETPAELVENQQVVKAMLVPEEWERLQLDDIMRTINAYYKFKYRPSKVKVVQEYPGCIVYQLENENIDSDDYWVLMYEYGEKGKLDNIREYRVIADGGNVEINDFINNS